MEDSGVFLGGGICCGAFYLVFSGKILGLTAGYLSKSNFQNFTKFLPKDYTLWKTWGTSLIMGGIGISLGDVICLTVRWG